MGLENVKRCLLNTSLCRLLIEISVGGIGKALSCAHKWRGAAGLGRRVFSSEVPHTKMSLNQRLGISETCRCFLRNQPPYYIPCMVYGKASLPYCFAHLHKYNLVYATPQYVFDRKQEGKIFSHGPTKVGLWWEVFYSPLVIYLLFFNVLLFHRKGIQKGPWISKLQSVLRHSAGDHVAFASFPLCFNLVIYRSWQGSSFLKIERHLGSIGLFFFLPYTMVDIVMFVYHAMAGYPNLPSWRFSFFYFWCYVKLDIGKTSLYIEGCVHACTWEGGGEREWWTN